MRFSKKGSMPMFLLGGIFVLVLALVVVIGWNTYKGNHEMSVGVQNPIATPKGSGCSVAVGSTQTPSLSGYNKDTNAYVALTQQLYLDAVAGKLAPSNNTNPGSGYTAYVTASGYAADSFGFTTSCTDAAPQIEPRAMIPLDTSISFAVYNQGGHTANAVTANQSITAGASSTLSVEMTPSAVAKHLAGSNGKFMVYFNASNQTYWDTTLFAIDSDFATCSPFVGPTPTALGGVVVTQWECTGDFTGKDTKTYILKPTIGGSANYAASGSTPSICVVPEEAYQNTVDNSYGKANAVLFGGVKNNGAAIATAQCVTLYLK